MGLGNFFGQFGRAYQESQDRKADTREKEYKAKMDEAHVLGEMAERYKDLPKDNPLPDQLAQQWFDKIQEAQKIRGEKPSAPLQTFGKLIIGAYKSHRAGHLPLPGGESSRGGFGNLMQGATAGLPPEAAPGSFLTPGGTAPGAGQETAPGQGAGGLPAPPPEAAPGFVGAGPLQRQKGPMAQNFGEPTTVQPSPAGQIAAAAGTIAGAAEGAPPPPGGTGTPAPAAPPPAPPATMPAPPGAGMRMVRPPSTMDIAAQKQAFELKAEEERARLKSKLLYGEGPPGEPEAEAQERSQEKIRYGRAEKWLQTPEAQAMSPTQRNQVASRIRLGIPVTPGGATIRGEPRADKQGNWTRPHFNQQGEEVFSEGSQAPDKPADNRAKAIMNAHPGMDYDQAVAKYQQEVEAKAAAESLSATERTELIAERTKAERFKNADRALIAKRKQTGQLSRQEAQTIFNHAQMVASADMKTFEAQNLPTAKFDDMKQFFYEKHLDELGTNASDLKRAMQGLPPETQQTPSDVKRSVLAAPPGAAPSLAKPPTSGAGATAATTVSPYKAP